MLNYEGEFNLWAEVQLSFCNFILLNNWESVF